VRREGEKEKEKPKIYEVLGEKEGGTGDWDHWEGSVSLDGSFRAQD
jgi:hypothetical protein